MQTDPLTAFIEAACVPLDQAHVAGTLERAESIRAAHPDVEAGSIHAAAILGDHAAVRRFIELDARNATAKGGPRGWDALTHLCFSRYLRLDPARSDGFVHAARTLLDAGASANTGWFETSHLPSPEWESVLYGAAGIAHHPELTHLLLERGADPNDNETVYHTPESYDNRAMKLLVETGKLTAESLSLMLVRKHDWHDYEGVKWLLEHGADPNHPRARVGFPAIHHALARDNALRIVELLLERGADPMAVVDGMSAAARAARRGRRDVLEWLEQRRIPFQLHGVERLIGACARDDGATVRSVAEREPELVAALLREGGDRLAEFAGNGNAAGVAHLVDLGVPVAATYKGDGYWGVARNSTALHVAAWRLEHEAVKLLIRRGAPVEAEDGDGRTPLALAVRACVDSYWTHKRSPASVDALLRAGAPLDGIAYPSGYAEVDELLRRHRETAGR